MYSTKDSSVTSTAKAVGAKAYEKIGTGINRVEHAVENAIEKPLAEIGLHTLSVAGLSGATTGIALEKSGLATMSSVRKQIMLKDFRVLKVFLSSLGTGFLTYGAANLAGMTMVTANAPNILLSVLGGSLSGLGAFLAGATPELLYAQIAKWDPRSLYAFFGGILGSASYGLLYANVFSKWNSFTSVKPELSTVHGYLGVPYYAVALPMAVAVAGGCYLLEQIRPTPATEKVSKFDPHVTSDGPVKDMIYAKRWNPYLCGVMLGLAQLPAYYATKVLFETSTVNAFVARMFSWMRQENSYFSTLNRSRHHYFQMIFDIGIVLGTVIAAKYMRRNPQAEAERLKITAQKRVKEMDPATKIAYTVGGFCLFFGANLSGHSPMGLSKLGVGAIVTSLAMANGAYFSSLLQIKV